MEVGSLSLWERVTVSREKKCPSPDLLRKSTSPHRGEVTNRHTLALSAATHKPTYCIILHSLPAGKAVAAGTVARMLYQACGSGSSPGALTLAT